MREFTLIGLMLCLTMAAAVADKAPRWTMQEELVLGRMFDLLIGSKTCEPGCVENAQYFRRKLDAAPQVSEPEKPKQPEPDPDK